MSLPATSPSDIHNVVLSSAMAPNTRLAYNKGWACFTAYCARERIADPLSASPEVVARFLLDCATQPPFGTRQPVVHGHGLPLQQRHHQTVHRR